MSDSVRPVTPLRPVAGVSLDRLAQDPAQAAALPSEIRRAVVLQCLTILGACAVGDPPDRPAREPDRVLGIEEAAARLGMTKDFLYRHWAALRLGYKDADGHVKFPLAKVERYIRLRGGPAP